MVRPATNNAPAKPKAAPKAKAVNVKPKSATTANSAISKISSPKISKSKVKDDMNNFKEKATETARNAADRGKDKATEAVSSISKLIRDSAGTIDDNVGKNYGDYARGAAEAVDGFADKISSKEVDEIVEDARQFVRKSPAIAIGAAAAIGFVLARLIRSGGKDA